MSYNADYTENSEYFGKDADEILQLYAEHIDREFPILDIGAGQGRNTSYFDRNQFLFHSDIGGTGEKIVLATFFICNL